MSNPIDRATALERGQEILEECDLRTKAGRKEAVQMLLVELAELGVEFDETYDDEETEEDDDVDELRF